MLRMRSITVGLVVCMAAAGLAACGDDGSSGKVSAASLKSRLLPPSSVPGFRLQRTFDWSDPVNLAVEGAKLPESTHPSVMVKAFKDAGLKGAAGERLIKGRPPEESQVTIGVVKLKSAEGARQARDAMHAQDLIQPCFTACIFSPRNLPIPGVPTATAVKQTPSIPPPPGGGQGPPTFYLVEFTVGPYLYFSTSDGSPSDARKVIATTQRYYQRVRKLPG